MQKKNKFSDDPTSNEDYENRFDNSNIDYGATSSTKSNNSEDWDLIASTVPNHEKSLIAHRGTTTLLIEHCEGTFHC